MESGPVTAARGSLHCRATSWIRGGGSLILALLAGCDWIALAQGALAYDDVRPGEVANVVALDSLIYASRADSGLSVIDARTNAVVATAPVPQDMGTIDDLALDGILLFALDARPPGYLVVLALEDPRNPRVVASPREVPVGPFSGVSARNGVVVISGGTSELTAWRYDRAGVLDGPTAIADLGRGQPDVLLSEEGDLAFVSTHYSGPRFGLDIVRLDGSAAEPRTIARVPLDRAGFTPGGAKPANFPIESAIAGDGTLLVAHAGGLALIDVAVPGRPRVAQVLDVGGSAVNVDASGPDVAIAVTTGDTGSIVLARIEGGRARIVRRMSLPPGTFPLAVVYTPHGVAVAARGSGVLLVDR